MRNPIGDTQAERHLLAAVLLRAVRDYAYTGSEDPEEARVAEAAREWIFEGSDDVDHIGAFCTICTLMDLDADRVRARILRMESSNTEMLDGESAPQLIRSLAD